MNCIVTAGPTYEPLDQVRRLTNFSTGKLGSQLADYLSDQGHEVVLLKGHYSTFRLPSKAAHIVEFGTIADLEHHLRSLAAERIDAVFHAAAIGDFKVSKIWTRHADGRLTEIKSGKLSTRDLPLLVELAPTPKLLARLRAWFPLAWLAGWKYEVDGDQSSAVARANGQIRDYQTNASVVNGPAYGEGFGLLNREGALQHLPNTLALFECLERQLRR